jgi:hypothetical protein
MSETRSGQGRTPTSGTAPREPGKARQHPLVVTSAAPGVARPNPSAPSPRWVR